MSVCRHIWFYIKKHTRTKTPTFGIAVVWKHRTGREKERKTFIKQHADWYWPLHVVTMQGAKHHMQVIFRDPETEEGKRWFMAGGPSSRRVAFCLWADPGIPDRAASARASRDIKSDLGEVWTRSAEDKIWEAALMVQREKIGPKNTRVFVLKY